ncbi:MAG TPA: LiaF domain-containing protein, partial [Egibacteraceae bacterium]|nr:LiaF domain-containing protein [Egibacteraceae bacterium]
LFTHSNHSRDPAPLAPPSLPTEPPSPRRPKSRLGRLTLALMFLALGVAGFLDATAVLSPSAGDYAALVLAAVGTGLVIGAWWGRARALIPLGVVLVPVVLVASILPEGPSLAGGSGEVYERPASSAALEQEYRLGAGQLTVDLRDVVLAPGEVRALRVTVGFGEVTVVLPDSVTVVARADAGIGTVDLFGMRTGGLEPQLGGERTGSPFSGTLDLTARAGVGQVRVVRVAAGAPLHPFGDGLFGPGSEVF